MNKIVWIGPMGSDETSRCAKDILQYFLSPACAEHGFSLYYPRTLDADNWLTELIHQIRSANGVICDISGGRCNVYFEFGVAYALNIPTILLCRADTDVHGDLKNIQYHTYTAISDVEELVKEWLLGLSEDDCNLSKVTQTLPHPFHILEGDGHHEYVYDVSRHRKSFIIDEVEEPLTLESIAASQPAVGKLLSRIHKLQKKIASITSRPFFHGDLLGYVQHTPMRDELGTSFGATVGVRRTNYYTFVASHYPFQSLDDALRLNLIDNQRASSLRDQIAEKMRLSLWPFAQPLTAMVFLVAELDGKRRLYFQKRNTMKNFHAPYPKQATAGGMIHPSRIVDQHGSSTYSPEIAFLHELCEEAGVSVPIQHVKILGLVREAEWQECAFVGYVVAGRDQLNDRKLPIDSFESDAFESVPLQPSFMVEYLRHRARGGKDLSPLTLAALSLLLVHEFGLLTLEKIFRDAAAQTN